MLVCGVGSIGERHIRNALALGVSDIRLYRQRKLALRTIEREFPTFTSLQEALLTKPKIAVICNPTAMHIDTAIACAAAGCHLLIEKPIGNRLDRIDELERLLTAKNLCCMIAYMGRFHPCVLKLREWIDAGHIGELIYYRSLWGEYLPDWHPYEDYRESYAARLDLGGGPTHTLSHELDMLYWFLGVPNKIMAMRNVNSDLDLQTEHGMDMLFQFSSGATANIHVDYFQKPPSRRLEISGTKGKVTLDYFQARAELFQHDATEPAEIYDRAGDFDRNDQFVAELKYFLACIASGSEPRPSLTDGKRVLEMALTALNQ